MEWTILQPSPFMETCFSKIAGWDVRAGTVNLLGDGRTPVAFVSYRDVATIAVRALLEGHPSGAIPVHGPEAVSPRDAIRRFEESLAKPLRVRCVPVAVMRVVAAALVSFQPMLSSILTMGIETSTRGDGHDPESAASEPPIAWTTVRAFAQRVAGGNEP